MIKELVKRCCAAEASICSHLLSERGTFCGQGLTEQRKQPESHEIPGGVQACSKQLTLRVNIPARAGAAVLFLRSAS